MDWAIGGLFNQAEIPPLTHQYRNNKSNSPKGGGSDGGMYRGRTDDVMKLLMIGFEGL